MDRILIADDDKNIARLISDSLSDEGFECVVVHDGKQALELLSRDPAFSLVLLDIMMPGMDGKEVLRRVRDMLTCPIIFVTAKSRTVDTLVGLEMGADDYITKPFVVEELVGKVKAHIRRDKRRKGPDDIITLGDMTIRRQAFELSKNGEPVPLTTREFALLMYLYDHAGQVLTREQIFDGVWGMDYFDLGTVTVTIKNLRDKIDPDNRYIKTVWGVGYKLVQ